MKNNKCTASNWDNFCYDKCPGMLSEGNIIEVLQIAKELQGD